MKKLFFLDEEYVAEKIIKRENSIIGMNGENKLFMFSGISNLMNIKYLIIITT